MKDRDGMVMYVTLELPVRTMSIKSTMCKYIYLPHLLYLRPVCRWNLFILHLSKLPETWFCIVASVSEGLDWQFVFWFCFVFFFITCQLSDNINSQLDKAVRRLAYMGDLFYLLWNISS